MNVTIVPQSATLLWITADAAKMIERSGRVCYKSEDKITDTSAATFVEKICKLNHESVIEHAAASFLLTTDRGITHELVRHRIASYSQESTRYVGYHKKSGLQVVEPLDLPDDRRQVWLASMVAAADAYEKLVAAGAKPQEARDVLPTCTKADIVVTANLRAWKHIIAMRTSAGAHPKIRVLIGMVRDILQREVPAVFGAPA